MKLLIGDTAPKFSLPDQTGKTRQLSDYSGSWLLVYFYPKDETPGCTKEACTLRDNFKEFVKYKIAIVGINTDSVITHKKFATHHVLPFPLLSDESKQVVTAYDVFHSHQFMNFFGTIRTSFLITPQGKIAKIYEKVNPEEHAKEVITDVISLIK